jgi:predicted negative regulator of RcsB-dependent stress response
MNSLVLSAVFAAKGINDLATSDFNSTWIIVGVVVVVVGVASYLAFNAMQKKQANSHSGLFNGLCRHHGLDSSSKKLLRSIAQHIQINHPARLFLEPGWLDLKQLGPEFQAQANALKSLRKQLFG